mgnify:CR=1 FL=1
MDQSSYQRRVTTQTAEQEVSVLAIGSLIASILGLTALPTVGSLIGLVLGYVARGEIRSTEKLTGEGYATAGIILGWIGIVLGVLAFLLVILIIIFGFAAIPGLTICANLGRGF